MAIVPLAARSAKLSSDCTGSMTAEGTLTKGAGSVAAGPDVAGSEGMGLPVREYRITFEGARDVVTGGGLRVLSLKPQTTGLWA